MRWRPLLLALLSAALLWGWVAAGSSAQSKGRADTDLLSPAAATGDSLALLALNVAHGRGTALNQMLVPETRHRENLDAIAELIQRSGAVVVALQEADGPSPWSGGFDHVAYLARASGHRSFVHGYQASSWLYDYGTALLSQVRLYDSSWISFAPSWPTTTKGYVRADIHWLAGETSEAVTLTLVSVHLDFSRKSVRESQVNQMIEELSTVSNPLVIMGDFNADWSTKDSPVRRLAEALHLHTYDPTAGGLGTYKQSERLDWVLVTEELHFIDYTVIPDTVSDHLAVFARIGLNREE